MSFSGITFVCKLNIVFLETKHSYWYTGIHISTQANLLFILVLSKKKKKTNQQTNKQGEGLLE